MPDRPDSPPPVSAARILAIYRATKSLHLRTGGDPAEASFELLAAACLIIHEARPMRSAAEVIADVAPHAEVTALEWFSDMVAEWRRGMHNA
ncbi:hypothetical protein [Pararhodobacter zhoushanensis]|uniref:Uncharacterized protein n=1 Tax=Pararhodobacter zhoushanensis TaxID=2479545 RepID=A0ABT3GYT3_9RHOB|nr:hypothetical protein [Pararhodobacter zhoushanensis]MCW1932650.1 hypothetical protein [Pararhodobacter zhoushanensis]